MPSPLENGAADSGPHAAIWLTEPSAPAVEMGHLAGYDTVVPMARLEYTYLPSVARIADAARKAMAA